ncbi:PREDICTED: protein LNK2 isoform X2 [Tarenaya hassleriana]|uniref:protein LNK2 isoform X2 n=1 Tax=Tarenaya hassleriana TaxID=28532 RepID=UPI00053C0FAE|nr:PREDICTED: protein LNK2 isoform X2 [Tarenaya hassleriana]
MFDWNDEELNNIIWGDDGETDDHIVPFKERSGLQLNRKEWSEKSKSHKPAEQKTLAAKIDLHGKKVASSYNDSEEISSSDFGLDSWPETSVSLDTRVNQDSSGTEVSNSLAEPAKFSSTSGEKTSDLGKGPNIFHNSDESKGQSDFVDYSWANIGSFDDLDRMFSNDVPIFGDGSLSSADELWPSSKDVSNSPPKSFPSILDFQNIGLDTKTDFEQQGDQPLSLSGKTVDPSYQNVQNACPTSKIEQYPGYKGQSTDEEQAYQQKKLLKFSAMPEGSETRTFQDVYGTWSPSRNSPGQFENQLTPSSLRSSSVAMNPQRKLQGSETSQYMHMPNPYTSASGFGNLSNPYSAIPLVSTIQSPDPTTQLLHPSYNISPVNAISANKAGDASARPLTMTPQEKLEKLRRRQQMQAMLAIQRQQQQFRHQVPGADQPVGTQDNPLHLVDKTYLDEIAAQPSFDPNSPLEQDDSSNCAVAADNSSAEFSVLYRLQDVVAKLDTGIRLCMRDSLFRLAGSAVKRHHAGDTTCTNKTSCNEQESISVEDARKGSSYAGMPDTETVTNPIDRTVAHLLFHRHFEVPMKNLEGPESPVSSKMGTERKVSFPKCSTPESYITKQKVSEEGPAAGTLASTQQTNQFETSPSVDTSANTLNCRSSSVGGAELEALPNENEKKL